MLIRVYDGNKLSGRDFTAKVATDDGLATLGTGGDVTVSLDGRVVGASPSPRVCWVRMLRTATMVAAG